MADIIHISRPTGQESILMHNTNATPTTNATPAMDSDHSPNPPGFLDYGRYRARPADASWRVSDVVWVQTAHARRACAALFAGCARYAVEEEYNKDRRTVASWRPRSIPSWSAPVRAGVYTPVGRAVRHWDTPAGRLVVTVRLAQMLLLPRLRAYDAAGRARTNACIAEMLGLDDARAAGLLLGHVVVWQQSGRWPRRPRAVRLTWAGGKNQGAAAMGGHRAALAWLAGRLWTTISLGLDGRAPDPGGLEAFRARLRPAPAPAAPDAGTMPNLPTMIARDAVKTAAAPVKARRGACEDAGDGGLRPAIVSRRSLAGRYNVHRQRAGLLGEFWLREFWPGAGSARLGAGTAQPGACSVEDVFAACPLARWPGREPEPPTLLLLTALAPPDGWGGRGGHRVLGVAFAANFGARDPALPSTGEPALPFTCGVMLPTRRAPPLPWLPHVLALALHASGLPLTCLQPGRAGGLGKLRVLSRLLGPEYAPVDERFQPLLPRLPPGAAPYRGRLLVPDLGGGNYVLPVTVAGVITARSTEKPQRLHLLCANQREKGASERAGQEANFGNEANFGDTWALDTAPGSLLRADPAHFCAAASQRAQVLLLHALGVDAFGWELGRGHAGEASGRPPQPAPAQFPKPGPGPGVGGGAWASLLANLNPPRPAAGGKPPLGKAPLETDSNEKGRTS